MPILDLQKRARELGRIRLGQVQQTSNGKTRPAKLDRFRLTSASKPLLEKVAALYGGQVRPWTPANGGPQQWEVITDATRLPILVPPQPVSQWYELWSGGGCQRRCDGQREIISESPCVCAQDDERLCKPTTRLNVVLRDVEGIGVFRLESHGYYAAVELPNVAAFLEQAGGYVSAFLVLEERVVKREGEKPKRFMVPAIEIEGVTPGQLVQGQVVRPEVGAGEAPAAVSGARPAIEAPSTVPAPSRNTADGTPQGFMEAAERAATKDELTKVLRQAQAAGFAKNFQDETDEVAQVFLARLRTLDGAPTPAPLAEDGPDRDAVWSQIVAAWPGDRTSEIEEAFEDRFGVKPSAGSGEQLAEFLAAVQSGAIKPAQTESGVPF